MLIGILFTIQHWFGGYYLIYAGVLLQVVFNIMTLIEIVTSVKARRKSKLSWGAAYLFLPLILSQLLFKFLLFSLVLIFIIGTVYLTIGRKYFIPTRNKLPTFDSFEID